MFDQASKILGLPDFTKVIFEGPEEELTKTINAQVAIMTVSIANVDRVKEARGGEIPKPKAVGGHSLGLYTAAVIAGSLSFEDGLKLVAERSRLMQEASEKREGGMVAIIGEFDLQVLEEICLEAGVEIANINSDNQIIISGDTVSIANAIDFAGSRGLRARKLPVSGAWHSSLMLPAQEGFEKALSTVYIKDPEVQIVANSEPVSISTAEGLKEEFRKTLCRLVNWRDGVRYAQGQGVANFIEFGPKKVLADLIGRTKTASSVNTFNVNSLDSARRVAAVLSS